MGKGLQVEQSPPGLGRTPKGSRARNVFLFPAPCFLQKRRCISLGNPTTQISTARGQNCASRNYVSKCIKTCSGKCVHQHTFGDASGGEGATEPKLKEDWVAQETEGKTAHAEGAACAKAPGHKMAQGREGRGERGRGVYGGRQQLCRGVSAKSRPNPVPPKKDTGATVARTGTHNSPMSPGRDAVPKRGGRSDSGCQHVPAMQTAGAGWVPGGGTAPPGLALTSHLPSLLEPPTQPRPALTVAGRPPSPSIRLAKSLDAPVFLPATHPKMEGCTHTPHRDPNTPQKALPNLTPHLSRLPEQTPPPGGLQQQTFIAQSSGG